MALLDDDEEYEVEAILGLRDIKPGQTPEFYVKWLGWPDSANTWEPLENLENCPELVKDFLQTTFAKKMAAIIADTTLESECSVAPNSCESVPSIPPSTPPSTSTTETTTLKPALMAFEDIFKDSEGPKITVENDVDDEGCPPDFHYVNEPIFGKGVKKPDMAFASYCSCGPGGCGVGNSCDCMTEAMEVNDFKRLPFEEDGRVAEHATKLLWECNSKCGCGPDCISKASQKGRAFALKIKRYHDKGWGAVLNQAESIPPRTFISRYIGEIINAKEAWIREKEYKKIGKTWLFDLDYNTEGNAKYSIDAYKYGNESHFFNHSCDPNMSVYMLGGHTADGNLLTLSFWTNRWIHQGDELTFDYTGRHFQSWFKIKGSEDEQAEEDGRSRAGKKPCRCGAKNCRKWIC